MEGDAGDAGYSRLELRGEGVVICVHLDSIHAGLFS
jgi:hypothetical protein